jgi:hypothetical protein
VLGIQFVQAALAQQRGLLVGPTVEIGVVKGGCSWAARSVVLWSAFQAGRASDAKAGGGSEMGPSYAIMRGCIRR